MMKNKSSSFLVILFLVIFVSTISLISASIDRRPYESESSSSSPPNEAYVVYIRGDVSESHYLSILSSVLGSREAARESLIVAFTETSGFAARMTPEQASEMKRQPEVLQIRRGVVVKGPGDTKMVV